MKKNHRYANIDIVAGKKGFFSQAVINLLQNREKTVWKHGHVAFVSIGEDVPQLLLQHDKAKVWRKTWLVHSITSQIYFGVCGNKFRHVSDT